MEPQQQQQQQQQQGNSDQEQGGKFLCRQSSTRWTPTTDQIRILKDLYYNNGIRSPSAEQIQRISAKLRQYGKIEGKNVFYWFQNHKARERQKKRFTADIPMHKTALYNSFPNINPSGGFPSSSASNSPGLVAVGSYGYGSVAMEKSFRECTINGGGGQNFAWMGVDPYSSPYPNFLEKRKFSEQTLEIGEEEGEAAAAAAEIETLPLFPMHGDQVKQEGGYFSGWHRHGDDGGIAAGSRASLELTLNSYAARFSGS